MMAPKSTIGMALLACIAVAVDGAGAQPDPTQRGRALVSEFCSACHAIGKAGNSPHAGAPPFRNLGDRVELDTFADRLREGLQSTHADMPSFRFTRDDARAVIAYLRSLQTR